jgi:hypothetical protein
LGFGGALTKAELWVRKAVLAALIDEISALAAVAPIEKVGPKLKTVVVPSLNVLVAEPVQFCACAGETAAAAIATAIAPRNADLRADPVTSPFNRRDASEITLPHRRPVIVHSQSMIRASKSAAKPHYFYLLLARRRSDLCASRCLPMDFPAHCAVSATAGSGVPDLRPTVRLALESEQDN